MRPRGLRERDRGGDAGLITVRGGRMTVTGDVLDEARITRAEDLLGSVSKAVLELPGNDDHKLAPRSRMPVLKVSNRRRPELDALRIMRRGPLRVIDEVE